MDICDGLPAQAVPEALLGRLRHWLFDEHVARFVGMNPDWVPALELKATHTCRVCAEILQLGRRLDLDDDGLRVAELSALLHDVGRFEQYARFQTYSDRRTFDHAGASVATIRALGLLEPLQPAVQQVVLEAVCNHNRLAVPETGSPASMFFSRLLRDADKLDIWRVAIDEYQGEQDHAFTRLDLPDTPGYQAAALQALDEGRMVSLGVLRNINDLKLLQLGWFYDLNFQPSFACVRDGDVVDVPEGIG